MHIAFKTPTGWPPREHMTSLIAVSSQCSQIQMYSHAHKVLRVWLHVPPRSCPSLQEDTFQAQAVIPSFTSNGKFYYSLRGIFSFRKSGELEQKIIL